ncbi:Lysine exporter protein (LYSE/YGGA) [[Clostridium] ultunense Esp]|uniref:Lysine exporter protein (LYSE/YGGA) n=1 Tax=[Clostridium] ultunense Esp TaxID=1288971 RepID=M1ZF73_9FIRM|nr:LysE family transporter [Schnuerera ultunensis]CCQ96989.1 Lysine exporter protein (LYSE/YGGA) [[Clostridium] ultunense Esp]SHD76460.1 Lysine exporter protein (LYSE/YGGA) [[Clostridium] ultunense Esp]
MGYLLQGLMLGFGYVAPIGMQNLYVINSAIRETRGRAYRVAFITIFFDITLALACFFGIGLLLNKVPILKGIIVLIGSIVVIYIGYSIIKSSPNLSTDIEIEKSFIKILRDTFAVTWLNPQAIIDGSLLLGGYHAYIPNGMSKYFILGFCLASFLWFFSLSTIVSVFQKRINKHFIKWINIICGIIIIFFGFRLGYSFLKEIFL